MFFLSFFSISGVFTGKNRYVFSRVRFYRVSSIGYPGCRPAQCTIILFCSLALLRRSGETFLQLFPLNKNYPLFLKLTLVIGPEDDKSQRLSLVSLAFRKTTLQCHRKVAKTPKCGEISSRRTPLKMKNRWKKFKMISFTVQ